MNVEQICTELASLSFQEIMKIKDQMESVFYSLQKVELCKRLRKYFDENKDITTVCFYSSAECSSDGMYYGIGIRVNAGGNDITDLFDDIDMGIFGNLEGSERESWMFLYPKDFKMFDDYIDYEEDED